jgi:hypothetical protein
LKNEKLLYGFFFLIAAFNLRAFPGSNKTVWRANSFPLFALTF